MERNIGNSIGQHLKELSDKKQKLSADIDNIPREKVKLLRDMVYKDIPGDLHTQIVDTAAAFNKLDKQTLKLCDKIKDDQIITIGDMDLLDAFRNDVLDKLGDLYEICTPQAC